MQIDGECDDVEMCSIGAVGEEGPMKQFSVVFLAKDRVSDKQRLIERGRHGIVVETLQPGHAWEVEFSFEAPRFVGEVTWDTITVTKDDLVLCGKQGCDQPATRTAVGDLTYHSCDEHYPEIEELTGLDY